MSEDAMAMIKILLVDDSETTLMTERTVLERGGYEVITARSADEGLELARREHPQLALVDADMPRAPQLETCRRLATDPSTADIPVVLMVPPTIPSPPEAQRTWRAVLGKPLLEHDLLETVRAWAGREPPKA
jgi:twitching motility two-component system response regulator PilH